MNCKTSEEFNEFLEGCQRGDRIYQKQFYLKYYGVVYNATVRYSPSFEEAEDLMQDIFIKVYNSLDKFTGDSYAMLGGWLKKLSINYCIDYNRKVSLEYKDIEDLIVEDIIDEESIESEFSLNQITNAIQRLSPRYKTVFNMFVIEGLTHDEISSHLELNPGTSKSNLYKAKENLRKYLRDGKSRSI